MKEQDEAVKEIINAMARASEIWGFSGALGVFLGTLYFSDKPMSLDDLSRESGYSKSTVSLNMNVLEHWGAAKKYRKPKDRKTYYIVERDLLKLARETIEVNVKRETEIMLESLARARQFMEEKGASESLLKKVEELENIYQLHKRFLDALSRLPPEKIEQMLFEFTRE